MRGVVHRERLKSEHRADRERQTARQPDPHERRGQHEQQRRTPSAPARPRARAAHRAPDPRPPSRSNKRRTRTFPATRSSAPDHLDSEQFISILASSESFKWERCPHIGRLRYLEAAPRPGARPRGTLVLLHAFPLNARMWEAQLALADTRLARHRAAASRLRRRRAAIRRRLGRRLRRRRHRSARRAARPAGGHRRPVDGRLRGVCAAAPRARATSRG